MILRLARVMEKKGGKRENEKDEKKKQVFVFFFHYKTIYEENDNIKYQEDE